MKKNSIAEIYQKARNGEWIDNQDLTYLVRQALKKNFPGVRFSVRNQNYSSINVGWTDGPTLKQVQAVIGGFETKSFDGMIDLAYSKAFWLYSDGSCSHAHTEVTVGSCGVVAESIGSAQRPDGVPVTNVASCYIFENRELSPGLLNEVLDGLRQKWGADYFEGVTVSERGQLSTRDWDKQRLVFEAASQTSKLQKSEENAI